MYILAVVGQDQKPREDHHGHAPGDEGLREVVPRLRTSGANTNGAAAKISHEF